MQIKRYFLLGMGVCMALASQAQQANDYTIPRVTPFSGANDYRTWSVEAWGGLSLPVTPLGNNDFKRAGFDQLGVLYGISLKKQIYHGFGLQADIMRGQVKGHTTSDQGSWPYGLSGADDQNRFKTDIDLAASLSGVFTLGTINWLNRQGSVLPYVSVGGGYMRFHPQAGSTGASEWRYVDNDGFRRDMKPDASSAFYIPVGVGAKLNVATGINLDLSYHASFINHHYFDGNIGSGHQDKFSGIRVGIEFALGNRSKPQLSVVNAPAQLAMDLYERNQDLKRQLDQSNEDNKQAIEGLRGQLEDAKKDSDGDGVADIFDNI